MYGEQYNRWIQYNVWWIQYYVWWIKYNVWWIRKISREIIRSGQDNSMLSVISDTFAKHLIFWCWPGEITRQDTKGNEIWPG